MTRASHPDAGGDRRFCRTALQRVSRSFAVCIRLLPPDLEHGITIAYLLCRIADTIEDAPELSAEAKSRLLAAFRRCLDAGADWQSDAGAISGVFEDRSGDDRRLTAGMAAVLRPFHRLAAPAQSAIRPWVQEMCDGMTEFARARRLPGTHGLTVLDCVTDLDRYCYYVAGTVGHLLTDLFRIHHGQDQRHARLSSLATSFGLGLQLTNIIKDVADDRQRGWSFVPRDLCEAAGVAPEDLLKPQERERARKVMLRLIAKARIHLGDALAYCLALPRSCYRIRLFCLTPLFFAVRTLRRAEHDPRLLDPGHKVKIPRSQVHGTIRMTLLVAVDNALVVGYYRRLQNGRWGSRR